MRAVGESRGARLMNAVLQDCAKSWLNGTAPAALPSKLRKLLPCTVTVAGQGTIWLVRSPLRSSAAVLTTLNVEPGG